MNTQNFHQKNFDGETPSAAQKVLHFVAKSGFSTLPVLKKLVKNDAEKINKFSLERTGFFCFTKLKNHHDEIITLTERGYSFSQKYVPCPVRVKINEKMIWGRIVHDLAVQQKVIQCFERFAVLDYVFDCAYEEYGYRFNRRPDVIVDVENQPFFRLAIEVELTPKSGERLMGVLRKTILDCSAGCFDASVWFCGNEVVARRYEEVYRKMVDGYVDEGMQNHQLYSFRSLDEVKQAHKNRVKFVADCDLLYGI